MSASGRRGGFKIVLILILVFYVVPAFFGMVANIASDFSYTLEGYTQEFLFLENAQASVAETEENDFDGIPLTLTMEVRNGGSGYAMLDEYTVTVFCFDDEEEYLPCVWEPKLDGDQEWVYLPAGRSVSLDYRLTVAPETSRIVLRCWSGVPGEESPQELTLFRN